METFLFDRIIFGPVKSRRLGNSLGVNLLPVNSKLCNFNCVYCECGWTKSSAVKQAFHPVEDVHMALDSKLAFLRKNKSLPDVITFAGNGEPTMHPQFARVVEDAICLRDRYCPEAKIVVLTNGALLDREQVIRGLWKSDLRIVKLDAGTTGMYLRINQPHSARTPEWVVEKLQCFGGQVIIQSLFLRGMHHGEIVDNTTDNEVKAWIRLLKKIKPERVMIYSLDRATPAKGLEKVPFKVLEEIARQVNEAGLATQVN